MNRNKHAFVWMALALSCVSCGNTSEVSSSQAPNGIDTYWDTLQNEESPNGYYRLKDGWYEGESNRRTESTNPSIYDFWKIKEKVFFQIEWSKDPAKVTEPNGKIIAMEAHDRYTEFDGKNAKARLETSRTILMKDGLFSIEQITVQLQETPQTSISESYYGHCDGVGFRSPWDESYLEPDFFEGASYSFSSDSDVLKIQKDSADEVFRKSSFTTFRFLPDLMSVKAITNQTKNSQQVKKSIGVIPVLDEGDYSFRLREEGPNIKVKKEGEELQSYPWLWTSFGSNYFPTIAD